MKRTNNMRFNNNKSRQQRFGSNGQGGGGGYRRNGHGQHRQHGQGGQAGVPDKRNLRRYQDLRDNYNSKARDALAGGDRVSAEYFYQHADHYFRMAKEIEDYLAQFEPVRHNEQGANGDAAQSGEHEQAAGGTDEQLPMPDTQEQAASEDRDNQQ